MNGLKKTAVRVWSGKRVPNKNLVIALGVTVSGLLMAYLVFHNLSALLQVGARVRWGFFLIAASCALASYVMIGLALREVLALLGWRISFPALMGIALVSTTANYFVSTAGVSGFALKAHLLHKRRVPYGTTVMASVVSSVIMYFVLAVIIVQGLVYLFLRLQGARIALLEGTFGLLVLLATSIALLVVFFDRERRGRLTRRLFHWLNHAVFLFSQSEIPREDFEEFEGQLVEGLEKIREGKGGLTKTIAFTGLDWGLAMLTLHFCFLAVGIRLPLGHLSAGFTVGKAATLIPVLPGGMGAMEGSMAAVFDGLGVGWGEAFVAVILYRLAYYILPGLISIFVLWGLKVSEPALVEDTLADILPEELRRKAGESSAATGAARSAGL